MNSATAALASSANVVRRMMAVLAADVVDYSRLTEIAEIDTHVRLRALRVETIDPCIVSYRGRIIKNTGDGFLASFDSAVDAVRCAVELQHDLAASEAVQPIERKIRMRLGLNVGEVITEAEDIFGASVNVAARLEQFSPPGGIVISDSILFVREVDDRRFRRRYRRTRTEEHIETGSSLFHMHSGCRSRFTFRSQGPVAVNSDTAVSRVRRK
ncbi:adenylate/guanylate cyclase domain-containing protein [Bradyrhizobium sp. TZ2]